ncbi:unnamed protein product, partial [Rotaria sordida]
RVANDLVETVLTDILHLQNLDHDDDKNSGVRELSEDENGLRELDENDMNDTDEFIVFATKPGISNDDEQISNIPRYSLNKLYTFSKTHHNSIHNSKQTTLNQNTSSTSILEKKDVIATNSQLNSNTEELFDQIFSSSPIESQNIILNEYIDKIICPSNSHLENYRLSEGVNEETARIGRLLLGSIPTSFIDDVHNTSQTPISVQSKLKNTRFIVPNQNDIYDSPRKIYSRTQQRIHEEYDEGIIMICIISLFF